jgi:hypothetical protein
MLDEHEGHARIAVRRHPGKESFESRQATGGGAEADDGEGRR